MPGVQAYPRIRRRLPCTLVGGQRGFVLNLSEEGLFVQTNLPPRPGTFVELEVDAPGSSRRIPVEAQVVWRRRVTSQMAGVTQSGMGLRIRRPPEPYAHLVRGLFTPEAASPDVVAVRVKLESCRDQIDERPR